jgi:uncharacterized protein (TIGR00369 family)
MTEPKDFAAFVESLTDGWRRAMGVRVTRATADEAVAELDVGPEHLQPLGIVHGGVYCGLVETAASIGAAVAAMSRGSSYVVGLENNTSFLHAVREGTLRATARPLTRGRKSHVWHVDVADTSGTLAATGRVRLLVVDDPSPLAGQTPQVA